jgi:adenylate cyclase class IV
MPSNKATLIKCSLSRYRLLLYRAETRGWVDEDGTFFDNQDTDVQQTDEYLRIACDADAKDAHAHCLYAQFLEKKRDYIGAEGKHTTQHNTTQHNTTQHNTTQHNKHILIFPIRILFAFFGSRPRVFICCN